MCSPPPVMVTSPDEWKILEWDENPKQNNMLWGDKIKKKMEFSQFHKLSYFTLNFPKVLIKVTTSFLLNCWSIWIQLSYYRFKVTLVHCYRVIALGLSIRYINVNVISTLGLRPQNRQTKRVISYNILDIILLGYECARIYTEKV